MNKPQEFFPITIGKVKRLLRLFEVKPGLKIAIINILGDTELVQACAEELAKKIKNKEFDVLVTAESKSIPLAHALSIETGKPYLVLRKDYKIYMGDAIKAETLSITTGKKQTLVLDEKDRALIKDKNVAIIDDVISTGSTLKGMENIIKKAGGHIAFEAAIFTEGDPDNWIEIISLGNLPIFTE